MITEEKFLLIDTVKDLKRNLYIFSEAVVLLRTLAFPYAKDDEDLMRVIKRIDKILGYKNL